MAKYERGVYEPSDEVRVFDGAEEEEDDAEGSRLPLLIVLALVVLCAFAGVVWLAYTQGVARGRTETPVLAAAPGPERVAPENPGGAEVPYQGFKIYEQPAPADEGDTPAPAAEAPQPAARTEPPPIAALKPPAQPAAPPAAATAKPAPPPATKPATPPPATRQAVAAPPPATKPAPPPAAPVATGAPRSLPGVGPGVAAKPPAPPAQVAAAPAAPGAYVLQIGAFKSQAEADAAWRAYSGRHAALLKGYGPNVQRVDLGDKGTWYRLRIAGFADRDVASALCDRLKADNGACFLGR
jgi:cell division protein FtsN